MEVNRQSLLDEFDFFKILTSIIRFLIKARRHLIIALVISIITAIIIFKLSTPEYESAMTAYSTNLQDDKAVGLIKDLERNLEEGDLEQLADKMGLSVAKVKAITSLKGTVEVNKYSTGESKEGFTIKVRVTDQSILDSLGMGIKKYIESSEYVKDQVTSSKLSLQYNITKTEDELRALDSLRSSLNKLIIKGAQTRGTSSNIVLSDLGYISSKRIELYDRLSSLKQQMFLCFDLKVVRKFSKFKKRTSPRFSYIFLGTLAFFEIIAIIIFFKKQISNALLS